MGVFARMPRCRSTQVKLKAGNVDIAYPPIIQSGGAYDLRVSAQSSDKPLSYDVIVCQLGARYQQYCANVARTYLVRGRAGAASRTLGR
jgi:nucleosome binding factor SPN SPT16 subunit